MSDHEDTYPLSTERYAEVLASADEPTRKLTLHVMAEHREVKEAVYVLKRAYHYGKLILPGGLLAAGYLIRGLA